MNVLLAKAERLFGDISRPKHFTEHTHCCECAEHDGTLGSHTPQSIGLDELGSPAWDPIFFTTDEAFKYYFPALIRLTLEGTGETYYLDSLLTHIIVDGPRNRRWRTFTSEQREFVVKVLEFMLEQRAVDIDRFEDADRLLEAITIWSDSGDGGGNNL